MTYTPNHLLKQIDKLLFAFLWNNKTPKIKRESIISNIEDGGLKMPDIYIIHNSFKIGWIKRLFDNDNSKWKTLTWSILTIKPHQINKRLQNIPETISNYHNQLLKAWFENNNINPITTQEILNEYLVDNNKYILIANNTITNHTLNDIIPNETKVLNSIENNGLFNTLNDLNNKLNTHLNLMSYNKLKCAIPKDWKIKIKNINSESQIELFNNNINEKVPQFFINSHHQSLLSLQSRDITNEMIKRKMKPLTVIETWVESYPFLNDIEWDSIFMLPFKILKEPYLQTFQYKVINRLINCNYNLHKWKISNSSTVTTVKV